MTMPQLVCIRYQATHFAPDDHFIKNYMQNFYLHHLFFLFQKMPSSSRDKNNSYLQVCWCHNGDVNCDLFVEAAPQQLRPKKRLPFETNIRCAPSLLFFLPSSSSSSSLYYPKLYIATSWKIQTDKCCTGRNWITLISMTPFCFFLFFLFCLFSTSPLFQNGRI